MENKLKDFILSTTTENYKKWNNFGLLGNNTLDVKNKELIANCFEYVFNVLDLELETMVEMKDKFVLYLYPIIFKVFQRWPVDKPNYLDQIDHIINDLKINYIGGINDSYHKCNGVDYIDYEAVYCSEYSQNYINRYIIDEKNN